MLYTGGLSSPQPWHYYLGGIWKHMGVLFGFQTGWWGTNGIGCSGPGMLSVLQCTPAQKGNTPLKSQAIKVLIDQRA